MNGSRPLYVLRTDARTNTVVAGSHDELATTRVEAHGRLYAPVSRAEVKLRYASTPISASIDQTESGFAVGLDEPAFGVVAMVGTMLNCVAPAVIETPLLDQLRPEAIEYMTTKIPMGRMGRAEEVAAVVHFLVSEDASFVTGQCYDVSGGRATY